MFPSIINTFNIVSPTDRLNSPSHSALHNSVSSVVTQIETVIGTDSSVLGTIIGDLRNPLSDGGGHVQSANKGGTGQTTYNKGDLLVATSSSVISKLAVSSTAGEVLVSDPNQAAGMKWGTNPNSNKISTSYIGASYSRGASSIFNILYMSSIAGSTLGASNAIRFTGTIPRFEITNSTNFITRIQYGTQSILSATSNTTGGDMTGLQGKIEGMIVGVGTSSIYSFIRTDIQTGQWSSIYSYAEGSVAGGVDSSSDKTLFITGSYSNGNNANSILTGLFVVEKIS